MTARAENPPPAESTTFQFVHAGTSLHPHPKGTAHHFPYGAIGVTIVEGDLCICVSGRGAADAVVARLNGTLIDDFCGLLADKLDVIRPHAAADDPLPGETPCQRLN